MRYDTIIDMKSYTFRVIIEPDEGAYHGYVPALKGCHTCGDTIEETKINLRDAIKLHVEFLDAEGLPIPEDNGLESFETVMITPAYA